MTPRQILSPEIEPADKMPALRRDAMVELRLMVPDAIAQRLAKLGWTQNAVWVIGSDWFTRLLLAWLARLGKPTQHRPPKPIQDTGLWPLIGCIEALPDPIHSSND